MIKLSNTVKSFYIADTGNRNNGGGSSYGDYYVNHNFGKIPSSSQMISHASASENQFVPTLYTSTS